MPENRDEMNDRLLQETHDAVIEMKAIVMGTGGRGGLIGEMQEVQLKVKDMIFRHGNDTMDVKHLLSKVPIIEKKVDAIDDELHEPKAGLDHRISTVESDGRNRQRMLVWILGIMAVVGTGLLGLMMKHVFGE